MSDFSKKIYKKSYKLAQHSILIHFEANDSNKKYVCLRASEVKPKLDRFILKKLGNEEIDENWVQGKNPKGIDKALKYRMIIERKSEKADIYGYGAGANKLPRLFWTNMGDGVKKNGIFFVKGLTLTITCPIQELYEKINDSIAEFFAVTNFGTMQDKGFGSFKIVDDNKVVNVASELKEFYKAEKCFRITVRQRKQDESVADYQLELFDTIKQVYSVMKSGSRDPFFHSYIYKYMHDNYSMGNEKAHLKETKVSPKLGREPIIKWHQENHKYVRALLGLGQKLEYFTDNPNPKWYKLKDGRIDFQQNGAPITSIVKEQNGRQVYKEMKEIIKIDSVKDEKGTEYQEDDKTKIDRIPSPIFFKIINNEIYIVAGRINEKILGKYFSFTNTNTEGFNVRINQTNGKTVLQPKTVLQIPIDLNNGSNHDFIDEFINSFVGFYNKTFLPAARTRPGIKKYSITEV